MVQFFVARFINIKDGSGQISLHQSHFRLDNRNLFLILSSIASLINLDWSEGANYFTFFEAIDLHLSFPFKNQTDWATEEYGFPKHFEPGGFPGRNRFQQEGPGAYNDPAGVELLKASYLLLDGLNILRSLCLSLRCLQGRQKTWFLSFAFKHRSKRVRVFWFLQLSTDYGSWPHGADLLWGTFEHALSILQLLLLPILLEIRLFLTIFSQMHINILNVGKWYSLFLVHICLF